MLLILVTREVFQLLKSRVMKEEQFRNMLLIFVTLEVFKLVMS